VPFGSYRDLVETIAKWIDRDDLKVDIPDWIHLSEVQAQRDLHLRFIDLEEEFTSDGSNPIALPDNLVELHAIRFEESPISYLSIISRTDFFNQQELLSQPSSPSVGYHQGLALHVWPEVGSGGKYTVFWKSGIPHLSEDNQSNWLLENAPDLLLYSALKHGAPFLGDDPRVQMWAGMENTARAGLKQQEWRAKTGGGKLSIRPDTGS
jgi:hypothetical protein